MGRTSSDARVAVGPVSPHAVNDGGQKSNGGLDGAAFRDWILRIAAAIDDNANELTTLDSAIGDADHGVNMQRGFHAVREALVAKTSTRASSVAQGESAGSGDGLTPGAILVLVGRTLVSKVGGASGPLYGTAFRAAGKSLGDDPIVDAQKLSTALQAALVGIQTLGSAKEGDKTMVDVLAPAVTAYARAVKNGSGLVGALVVADNAGKDGVTATIPMRAHKGRASYLGERSIGHQDPGATSMSLMLSELYEVALARQGHS